MDRRTTGIIATVVAVLLCGCPGLIALFTGGLFALISRIPDANIDIFGSNDPQSALNFGLGTLCLGILLMVIPVVVGILTLRNRPAPVAAPTAGAMIYTPPAVPPTYPPSPEAPRPPDEPIPPAS